MATKRGTRAKANRVLADPLAREVATIELMNKMVVVRESDASDFILFENMAYKTISILVPENPDLVSLLNDPLGPLFEPEKYGAVIEKRKGSKSAQFVFADILFVYHLGSAAMVGEDEDINFFTRVLLAALREHSVKEVYTFAVNRLARDEQNGADLGKAFLSRDMKIFTNGQDFDFSQPYGMTLWNLAVSIAAQERNGIVERNRLGRIAVARRNQWPHGPKSIPLGYRLNGKGLVPDDAERARVRNILEMMGDPALSTRQFVEQLGMMKVTRPGVKERYGDHATVALVRHPKDLHQSFVNMLALYETGVYEMPLPNPTKGAKVFGGLPVHGSDSADPKDFGFVVLRYEFGLPKGGWAPPEVFEAIRAKAQANRSFVNGIRERRAFGGRPPYEVSGVIYQLESSGMDRYRICRIEGKNLLGSEIHRPGTRREKSLTAKESVATIDVNELHRNVITTIVDTLANAGASGEIQVSSLRAEADQATRLRLTIDFHRRRAERAREEALRTDDVATAAAFRREAEIEERAVSNLCKVAAPAIPQLASTAEARVDVGPFVALLAKVVKSNLKVPGVVVGAIEKLIPDLRVFPTEVKGVLGWTATVRLLTEEGDILELGPICGEVACNVVHRATQADGSVDSKAVTLYAQGLSLEEIAERLDVAPAQAWHRVRVALTAQGVPDAALARLGSAPVPELRMMFGLIAVKEAGSKVLAAVNDPQALAAVVALEGLFPAGVDPAWAAGTLGVYYGELSVRGSWSTGDTLGQIAVDYLAEQGGSCSVEELVGRIGSLGMNVGTVLARVLGRYNKFQPAVLRADEPLSKGLGHRLNRNVVLRLVECPHCGEQLTKVLRITEVPGHLLCVHCRRSPSANYVYPNGYFKVGPATPSFRANTDSTRKPPTKSRPIRKQELTKAAKQAVVADYQNRDIPIGGEEGILAKHGITDQQMYQIVKASGVAPRQPFRKRKRG